MQRTHSWAREFNESMKKTSMQNIWLPHVHSFCRLLVHIHKYTYIEYTAIGRAQLATSCSGNSIVCYVCCSCRANVVNVMLVCIHTHTSTLLFRENMISMELPQHFHCLECTVLNYTWNSTNNKAFAMVGLCIEHQSVCLESLKQSGQHLYTIDGLLKYGVCNNSLRDICRREIVKNSKNFGK